ncbi:MAG: polysaccharide deacetylase family protein [Oscillospiraceae bacterium]|nr:polysaccharide deacetylase family protein [Oscillospiraceae bacterium]
MKIALTFDDGPSIYTTKILNTLQHNEGRLSFFVMGSFVEEHKGKIIRAAHMGCEIICHTWDHPDYTKLSKRAIKKQLYSTIAAIAKVTGSVTPIFRPPYGAYDEKVEFVARKLGLSMVNWSVDTKDWECLDADTIYSVIMNEVKDGDIILCHDVYDSTAKAMTRVIPDLIAQGYELVTVSELLLSKYGELEPGRMYTN